MLKYILIIILLSFSALAFYGGEPIILFNESCIEHTITITGLNELAVGELWLSDNCNSNYKIIFSNQYICSCDNETIMYTKPNTNNTYEIKIDYSYLKEEQPQSSSSSSGGSRRTYPKVNIPFNETVENVTSLSPETEDDTKEFTINMGKLDQVISSEPDSEPEQENKRTMLDLFLLILILTGVVFAVFLIATKIFKFKKQMEEENNE